MMPIVNETSGLFRPRRLRVWTRAALLLALACLSSIANAQETVRDNFSDREWDNNDGTANWSADWIEVDDDNTGPNNGSIRITTGGELRIQDRTGGGPDPSAAREANLAGATFAELSFDWRTSNNVDPSDSVTVEVSDDGGASWSTLEIFTGLDGGESESRTYDIAGYASSNTQVRFRVDNGYSNNNERFFVDFVQIAYTIVLVGTDLSVTQSDTPDPVNVASPLSYSLQVSNNGPDAATGVTVVNTLPGGVAFQSASSTQGSCSESGGTVTCVLGNMIASENATINIVVTSPFFTGSIVNTAVVSGNESDPVNGNNSSSETTVVQNLNVNQLCYLVADAGGGNGGNDLFTSIDTADFDAATNETNYGTGTGTSSIEAIAFNSATGVVYAADGGQLGTLSTSTGLFQPLPQAIGTGSGSAGNITFSSVDGLTYDATTGTLYGSHARSGNDLLIQIDMTTGAHVPNAFGLNVDYVQIQSIFGNTIVDDIAVDPTSGIMYASTNSGGSTDRLVTVNKNTGASSNVALITVPDIEGLGTDPSGQLWGTSGSQGILYEINKSTGVGSNGRPIDNGSDYEAVDCYATSPSVTADLGLSKTVDDATPQEGGTVAYTVTITNFGPGPATVVQVMDQLPPGTTFVSASLSQGTYDSATGDWYVGNIGAGSSASMVLQADVDAGTGGSTITNTASVEFLSQSDPNASNDSASVDINPVGTPVIDIVKSVSVLGDPVNGISSPKAIPGATMQYALLMTNSGTGPSDDDSLILIDEIPANMALRVADFDASTAGPVYFLDGTPASTLIHDFVSLDDLTDDIDFSNDGGSTWTYVPVPNTNGADINVNAIRINPKGQFPGDTGAGAPNFQVFFKAIVQ